MVHGGSRHRALSVCSSAPVLEAEDDGRMLLGAVREQSAPELVLCSASALSAVFLTSHLIMECFEMRSLNFKAEETVLTTGRHSSVWLCGNSGLR